MLTPLSQRPFHTVRLYAANTIDSITSLFFEILATWNKKWEAYANYYNYKVATREIAFDLYSKHIIHFCSNQLYPGKQVDVPTPNVTNEDFELKKSNDEVKIQGLCLGMCIDHMNRIKSSQKSFWETINEVGLKFSNGSTKKGYIYQHSEPQIRPSYKFIIAKFKKLFLKFKDTLNKDQIERLNDNEIYEILKENITTEYNLTYNRAKRISFFAQNYKCKFFKNDLDNYETLPDGDYFLRELPADKSGHIICLYKRKEGTVIFEPNYGTLFFKDQKSLFSFLESSTTRVFGQGKAKLSLFHCKDKEAK